MEVAFGGLTRGAASSATPSTTTTTTTTKTFSGPGDLGAGQTGRLFGNPNHSQPLKSLADKLNEQFFHLLDNLSNISASSDETRTTITETARPTTIPSMTRNIRQAESLGGGGGGGVELTSFSWLDVVVVAVLIGLILISIVGNCLVCVAICTDRRLRKLGNAFIVSLAIADLFVSCLVMTFALCNDLMNTWIFGDWFCDLWISFDIMCCTASILNLCAISLDRFIHIKDCLLYNQWMTKRVALAAVLFIWFISALVSIVPINLGWHRPPSSSSSSPVSIQLTSRALHRRELAWPTGELQLAPVDHHTNGHSNENKAGDHTHDNQEQNDHETIRSIREAAGKLNYKANGQQHQLQASPPKRQRRQSTDDDEIIKLAQANDLVASFTTPTAHQLQHERGPLDAGNGHPPPEKARARETGSAKWSDGPGVRTSGAHSASRASGRRRRRRRPIGGDRDEFLMNSQVERTRSSSWWWWWWSQQPDFGARNNINISSAPTPLEATWSPTSGLSEYIDHVKRPPNGRQQRQQQFNQVELNPTSRRAASVAHQTGPSTAAVETTHETGAQQQIKRLRRRRRATDRAEDSQETRPAPYRGSGGAQDLSTGPVKASGPGELQAPQCMLILTPTYAVVSSTISFYIPCIIMLGLYSKLFACARRHVKNIRAMARVPAPLVSTAPPPAARSSSSAVSVVGSLVKQVADDSGKNNKNNVKDNNHGRDAEQNPPPVCRPVEGKQQHKYQSGLEQIEVAQDERTKPAQLARPKVAWPSRACRAWIKFGRPKGGRDKCADVGNKETKLWADHQTGTPNSSNRKVGQPGESSTTCRPQEEQEPFLGEANQDQPTLNSLTADSLSLSKQVTCNSGRSISFRLNLAGLTSRNNNNNNNRDQQQQHLSSNSLATITMTNQQQQQQEKSTQTHKAAITLGIIMGTFLFCWVPFFCLNIIKAYCVDCIPSSMFRFFTWLGYANSALNPIIYGIHNSEFRNAFNRIFFKHLSLKNGRQYLNRRFSYDLRAHNQQGQLVRGAQNYRNRTIQKNYDGDDDKYDKNNDSSTSVTINQNNNNNNDNNANKPRQTPPPETATSNQLEERTTTGPLIGADGKLELQT